MAAPCSCLKKFPWKEKTQFSKTNLSNFITLTFLRPIVFSSNEHLYLPLASGTSICSVNSQLMTIKGVGTGILVKSADTLKETSSSSFPMWTDLRYSLKHCL